MAGAIRIIFGYYNLRSIMRIPLCIFLSLALFLGCDEEFAAPKFRNCAEDAPLRKHSNFNELLHQAGEKYAHVVAEIERFLDQILPCPLEPDAGTGWCEFVSVGFTPKSGSAKSIGQRILLIDDGARMAAYTRYKSRVLDDIAPDSQGIYHSVQASIELPRGELEILSHLLDEHYPDTPAIALQKILIREKEKPIFLATTYMPEHGDRIFGTLADLNPDAEFVIAGLWKIPQDVICMKGSNERILKSLGLYFDNLAQSLIKTIQKHDINFVNMSFGHTARVVEQGILGCAKTIAPSTQLRRSILQLIKGRFYDRLFSLKDVVFVQAGPWSRVRLQEGDPDYPIDCAHYPNRIRAGYIEELLTDIPPEGARRDKYVQDLGAKSCIDVFFNSGVVRGRNNELLLGEFPYLSTRWGIGLTFPSDEFSASWSTPFVLSYLNFKKQEAKESRKRFVYSHFHGSQLILEPVKYRQFEIFRTGKI